MDKLLLVLACTSFMVIATALLSVLLQGTLNRIRRLGSKWANRDRVIS